MNYIGIDPATRTGYAYRVNGVWVGGTVDADDDQELTAILTQAKAFGVTHAAIEDAYLGENPLTFKQLCRIQERIRIACARAGIVVRMVPAMTWKVAMLTVSGDFPTRRKEQKQRAMWVAERALGASPKTEDEADAVCLAEWGNCQRKVG